jgi:UPF0716 protein FxsA
MRGLFLLLIIVPIAELMFLLKVGRILGVFPTIALLIFMAAAGIYILKQQGFSTMSRAQLRMQSGEVPAKEFMEGVMLGLAGLLLLIPGFISDGFAFILLLPFTRRPLLAFLLRSGYLKTFDNSSGPTTFTQFGADWQQGPGFTRNRGKAYEGEFTREPSPETPLIEPDQKPPGEEK